MSYGDTGSRTARLVELVSTEAKLFHTDAGELYARLPVDGHWETRPLKSAAFKRWVARLFHQRERSVLGSLTWSDALTLLEATALYDRPEIQVVVRKAYEPGKVLLDLGDSTWTVIEITPEGWGATSDVTVAFRRPEGLLAMPQPDRGGTIDALREFVNVESEEDWRLLVAWLLAALGPHHPYPLLQLQGEQGCAKTTTAKVLRRLIDPNKAMLRQPPKEIGDLVIAANNGLVVAYDNLSALSGTRSAAYPLGLASRSVNCTPTWTRSWSR